MSQPLDLSKLFNLDDLSPLDKLIQKTDELDKEYESLAKNAQKNSDLFAKALQSVNVEAAKLEKSVQSLDSSVKDQQSTLSKASDDANKLRTAQDQLTKAQEMQKAIMVEVKAQMDKLAAAKKTATKLTIEQKVAQQEANRVSKLQAQLNRSQEGSLAQLRAQLALSKLEWIGLSKAERENTEEGRKLEAQVEDLNEELKKLEGNVGINTRSVGDYTNSIVEAGGKLGALTQGTQGFGSSLSGIVGSVPQLAALGAVVGGVGAAMDALQELTAEVKVELKQVADLTGLTGDNLTNLTGSIRATASVFEKDFNEILRTANVLSKEFGITQDEALNIVNEGLVRGADAGGDFLDQIQEYSAQFEAAGLGARGLLNVIDTSVKEGIFSDKGADLVKEAGLRLRELTPAAQDALKPLGELTNQQIRASVAAGDSFEGLKLVAAGLENANLSAQEYQTIIADVFGGAGEDAGARFIGLLKDIDQGFELTTESANKYQKAQLALLSAEQGLAAAQVEVAETLSGAAGGYKTLGLNIQEFALRFFLLLLEVTKPVIDQFKAVFSSVGDLIDELGLFSSEGEDTLTFFEFLESLLTGILFPVRLFITALSFVIEEFVSLVRSGESFVNQFESLAPVINFVTSAFDKFLFALKNAPAIYEGLLRATLAVFSGIRDLVFDTFSNVGDIIAGALSFDPAQLSKGLSNLKKPFNKFGTDVQDAFFEGFNSVRDEQLKENTEAIAENNDAVLKQQRQFAEKATKEQLEATKKRAELIRKAEFELNRFRLQEQISNLEEIAENEDLILASRLAAINEAADKRIDLAMLERDELLRNEALTAAGRTLIIERFQAKLDEIEDNTSKEIDLVIKLDADAAESELRDILGATLDQRIAETNIALAEELTALNESFNNKEISLIEFEQRRSDIERQFAEEKLNDQLAFLENQLLLLDLNAEDRLKIEEKIANTKLAISQKNNVDLIQKEKDLQNALRDLRDAAFDGALTVIDNLNEAEDLKREQDLEKLDEQQELELAAAEGNEERQAEINAKFAAERQKVEAEQSKADRKRAIFEKALAATTIAIDTARAIIATVAASPVTGGLPFSAIVGAIGAVQLAAVLSKPIPQFEKGIISSPSGDAIINEAGPEIMEKNGKRSIIYSDGPVRVKLQGGTRIYPADVSEKMLEQNSIDESSANYYNTDQEIRQYEIKMGNLQEVFTRGFDTLGQQIRNQKQPIINVNKKDLAWGTKSGQNFIEYMNHKYPN